MSKNKWQQKTLVDIPGVNEAATAVGAATGTLSGVLSTVKDALNILSELAALLPTPDNYASAIQEFVDQFANLFNSGCFFYHDGGPFVTGAKPDGLNGFLNRWKNSFDDLGDGERPQFTDNAEISAVLLVVGANKLPEFKLLLNSFGKLFGLPSWNVDEGDDLDLTWPERIEQGMSSPPDWKSVTIGDVIPVYDDLLSLLKQAVEQIQGASGWSDQISGLVNAIEQKIEQLESFSEQFDKINDALKALMADGLYTHKVSATSIDELAENALGADRSDINLKDDAYVAGVCLLQGGPDVSAFETSINAIFGV